MKCPNCTFENTDDARFCENCGQPLERVCPNCGNPIEGSPKFCKHCGHKLAGEPAKAREAQITRSQSLDALRRATPQSMASRIMEERERLQGERKLVTALFVDIVGSTAMAESMDPEDWRDVVSGSHERVSEAVYRYEGTIAQLLGDGVMVFFGAPLAHEDDPERAIRAGLDILEAIESYEQELIEAGTVDEFKVRIGLNTGLVVVGNIGSDLHMEYLAVGDTVNLASRLESAADPGTILVSEKTKQLAGPLFEFEDQGEIEVKGKSEPVRVFRVLEEKAGAVRARGIAGLMSPMVGRKREFATLLQRTEEVKGGQGSIVAILGEAGLGKSRLVAEWRKMALSENGGNLRWIEGRCLSFGTTMAHHLSTDVLRAMIGAPAGSSLAETRTALRSTVEDLASDRADEVYPYLGHLLGLELDENSMAKVKYLEGPALQAKYVSAFKHLLEALAEDRPTVLVCEDVHWADPSSVELGLQVLPVVSETPLIVALISRPDKDSAGWRMVERAREIAGAGALELHLAPLSDPDSQALVSNLLEVEDLPQNVRQRILQKTEGNPFFVEEVIRMLIDRGDLVEDNGRWRVEGEIESIDIPDTLQGVLTARIDRLPEEAKRALQVAAVIGRRFQVRVLEEVLRETEAG